MGIKNFIHPYREWKLCDSVDNKWSNNFAPFGLFGLKKFASIWAKKNVSKKNFLAKGWLGQGRGPKKLWFLSYLNYFTRYSYENLKLGLKLQNKIKISYKNILADGGGPTAETNYADFGPYQLYAKKLPKTYFVF